MRFSLMMVVLHWFQYSIENIAEKKSRESSLEYSKSRLILPEFAVPMIVDRSIEHVHHPIALHVVQHLEQRHQRWWSTNHCWSNEKKKKKKQEISTCGVASWLEISRISSDDFLQIFFFLNVDISFSSSSSSSSSSSCFFLIIKFDIVVVGCWSSIIKCSIFSYWALDWLKRFGKEKNRWYRLGRKSESDCERWRDFVFQFNQWWSGRWLVNDKVDRWLFSSSLDGQSSLNCAPKPWSSSSSIWTNTICSFSSTMTGWWSRIFGFNGSMSFSWICCSFSSSWLGPKSSSMKSWSSLPSSSSLINSRVD